MRLRQLEYFVAIAETGSYSAAAAKLFVAQPSLSQQIRGLEEELGGKLFERTSQGIRLTQGGKVFLSEARDLLRAVSEATERVRNVFNGRDSELVVSTVRSVASGILPPFVSYWHATVPGTLLRLRDFNHRRLVEASVTVGDSDIGVGPRPVDWSGRVESLGYEEIVIASGPQTGAVGEKALDPNAPIESAQDQASPEWVMYEKEHGFTEVVERYMAYHHLSPRVAARSPQVEAALLYAMAGVGTTLVPGNIVPVGWASRTRPCTPRYFREITAYARPDASALAEKCIRAMASSPLPLTAKRDLPHDALLA